MNFRGFYFIFHVLPNYHYSDNEMNSAEYQMVLIGIKAYQHNQLVLLRKQ